MALLTLNVTIVEEVTDGRLMETCNAKFCVLIIHKRHCLYPPRRSGDYARLVKVVLFQCTHLFVDVRPFHAPRCVSCSAAEHQQHVYDARTGGELLTLTLIHTLPSAGAAAVHQRSRPSPLQACDDTKCERCGGWQGCADVRVEFAAHKSSR